MALYSYVKIRPRRYRKLLDLVSYSALIGGSVFLFWSFYPIISFEIYSRLFIQQNIFSPVPQKKTAMQEVTSVLQTYNVFSTNLSEYTNAGIWFPTKSQNIRVPAKIHDYYISIPKINIKDAHVVWGGEDLAKSLVQYLPVVAPGENGNVNIFGHSTLPQLYDPKNYKTIFTYLPSLSKGDKIEVKVNNITYTYEVVDMFVVHPDQVSILEQSYDDAYLTLVTCVPPGTWWERLVVKSKLVRI